MPRLTRYPARPDNGRSLESIGSTPATSLRSRFFCSPHYARCAPARLRRSMGVSGIRKDPDAPIRVESTPTPFLVVLNLESIGGVMPKSTSAVSAKQNEVIHPYASTLTVRESRAVYRALELVRKTLVEKPIALPGTSAVRDYLLLELALEDREVFVCLFLDTQNRLIKAERMFFGTLTQAAVYPREVVKAALRYNAAAVIFAHNHPSGTSWPSEADKALTAHLKNALALVDVSVLDHFIVANGSETLSFASSEIMPFEHQSPPLSDRPVRKRRAAQVVGGVL